MNPNNISSNIMHNNKNKILIIGILIFIVALIVRLVYVESTEFIDPIRADAAKYFMLAENLVHIAAYSTDMAPPYHPTVTITPGYPLFLTPFIALASSINEFFYAVLTVQALLGSLTVLVLYLISLRLLPFAWAAGFGLILALLPHYIVFGGYILTETLFTALLTLSIYSLIKHLESQMSFWLILAGSLCSAAALTRPAALLLMPFIAVVLAFTRTIKLPKAVLLVMASFLLWMPWQIWSSQAAKQSIEQHSQFAAVFTFGSYPDFIFKSESMRGYPYREDPEYDDMITSPAKAISTVLARAKAEPSRYLYWYTIGKPVSYWSWNMMESVGGPFIYPVGKNIWLNTTPGQIALVTSHSLHRLLLLAGLPVLLLMLFNAVRRKPFPSIDKQMLIIATLVIVYFTSIHHILAAWPRYAVPCWSFFYLLGLWGLHQLSIFLCHMKAKSENQNGHT